MSDLIEYSEEDNKLYGAIYSKVPTFNLSLKLNLDLIAKPKSDIFHLLPKLYLNLPLRKMFAGLRSRCKTFYYIKKL